jgi:broad specificity phosphatase PhoE
VPQVPRAEWDFGSCTNDELFECRAYEYARETPAIVEDVRSLRKRVTPLFEELVKALRDRIDRTARVMALFWYCPEVSGQAVSDHSNS